MTVGREGGSRTALVGDQAVWSKGDKIYVSSKDGKTTGVLTLQGNGGDATGTFSGFVFGNPADLAYSVYPAPINGTTIDLSNISASGQLNAPMIGAINQSADVDVQFRNQCGILYINMNGSEGNSFNISANDIDIAADNTETENVLQFAGSFDVTNIDWASDGTPSLIFDNSTPTIKVTNTNTTGSNSSVMYVPYYITTDIDLDKVMFLAGDAPLNDEPINFGAENGFVGSVAKDKINNLTYSEEGRAQKSVVKVGDLGYATLEVAAAAAQPGETVKVLQDLTLTENLTLPAGIIFNGNGKQINGTIVAGGDLTFEGHTKVTLFSASYYNRTITIGKGACLEVTGTGRVTLGYGNTFNIIGSIENAKTAVKANVQPSLVIPGGISITGGNDAVFNVKNAYVQIGSTSSKNSAANGTFTLNIENSIAEFTNQLILAEPTNGMNPTFNINVKNSVLTTDTKFIVAAPNSTVVIDNSIVTLSTYFRNSGTFTLKDGSVLTGATIQFGENGGNNGTTNIDNSTFTITGGSAANALDGKGTGVINLTNGAVVSIDYYKAMTIRCDDKSTFTGTEVK